MVLIVVMVVEEEGVVMFEMVEGYVKMIYEAVVVVEGDCGALSGGGGGGMCGDACDGGKVLYEVVVVLKVVMMVVELFAMVV